MRFGSKVEGRFWDKVWTILGKPFNSQHSSVCWVWTGALKKVSTKKRVSGGKELEYGKFSFEGRCVPAHVMSYAIYSSRHPSDLGLIAHSCDNPMCVRPSHLKESVPTVNLKEAYERGRRPKLKPGFQNNNLTETRLSRAK